MMNTPSPLMRSRSVSVRISVLTTPETGRYERGTSLSGAAGRFE